MKYADNGIIDVPDILFLCQMSDMEMELATLLALECMHAKGKNSIIYFPFIYDLYNIYYVYYIHFTYIIYMGRPRIYSSSFILPHQVAGSQGKISQ